MDFVWDLRDYALNHTGWMTPRAPPCVVPGEHARGYAGTSRAAECCLEGGFSFESIPSQECALCHVSGYLGVVEP